MRTHRSFWLAGLLAAAVLSGCGRSDVGITAEIKAKMIADPVVQVGEIEVETQDGVVTLTGNINSEDAKQQALLLAKDTRGVVKVTDMIEVRNAAGGGDAPSPERTLGTTIDDAGVTLRVKQRLLSDPLVKGLAIDVDTRAGVVYLTGNVGTEKEKEQAISLARETEGVKDVLANLTVRAG